jgi:hypothetical protein
MKISELKNAIREMIVSELTEAGERTAFINSQPIEYKTEADLTRFRDNSDVRTITTAGGRRIKEDALSEMAFLKGPRAPEGLEAAITAVVKSNSDAELVDIRKAIRTDEKVIKALEKAKMNVKDDLADNQLTKFIELIRGNREVGPRGRKADPNKPAKEPKEPGKRGPKKGSKRSSDAIAFTMGGDVSISGKNVSPAEKRKAVKSAQKGKPVELLKIRDLEAIDKEIVDLSQELKSKLTKTKEIAAKGNLKDYTPEETAFMDDVKSKSIRISQLKATKEKILDKTVKRQDRNIDMANVDLD